MKVATLAWRRIEDGKSQAYTEPDQMKSLYTSSRTLLLTLRSGEVTLILLDRVLVYILEATISSYMSYSNTDRRINVILNTGIPPFQSLVSQLLEPML